MREGFFFSYFLSGPPFALQSSKSFQSSLNGYVDATRGGVGFSEFSYPGHRALEWSYSWPTLKSFLLGLNTEYS